MNVTKLGANTGRQQSRKIRLIHAVTPKTPDSNPQGTGMSEEAFRLWDTICKVFGPILTVAGLLVGIHQFNTEQANSRFRELDLLARNDRLEFKRKTWERQNTAYIEVAKTIGSLIAVIDQAEKRNKVAEQFETLYWGIAILNQDDTVREAIIKFRVDLHDVQNNPMDKEAKQRLKVRADSLVAAMRTSSSASWQELNGQISK